jgi:hypothetical protein
MPIGSPISGFQGGNRFSSGSSISGPIGEMPQIRSPATQHASSHRLVCRYFEKVNPSPIPPNVIMRFDGTRKTPRVLDKIKNMVPVQWLRSLVDTFENMEPRRVQAG